MKNWQLFLIKQNNWPRKKQKMEYLANWLSAIWIDKRYEFSFIYVYIMTSVKFKYL